MGTSKASFIVIRVMSQLTHQRTERTDHLKHVSNKGTKLPQTESTHAHKAGITLRYGLGIMTSSSEY